MRDTIKGENDMRTRNETLLCLTVLSALALSACDSSSTGGGDQGNLSVFLEAEDTITDGIQAGDDVENIVDGFNVTFTKYVVAIGKVAMSQAVDDPDPLRSPDVVIAEFTSLGQLPLLTTFDGIPTGQYRSFGFETPEPDADVENFNEVEEDDFNAMIMNGWSYIIEGEIEQVSDGAKKRFSIQADVPSVYSDCVNPATEQPGVDVASDSDVDVTLHGDHLVFNGFPEDETQIERRAKWLWDIPDDGDGVLKKNDFEAATNVEVLYPSSQYTLTGGPIDPINNAWDFVRAQLGTQGHIFGEGECEWSDLPEN